jgi:hypothetical protein
LAIAAGLAFAVGALWKLIPAREKADSEGLRRFESDGVNS